MKNLETPGKTGRVGRYACLLAPVSHVTNEYWKSAEIAGSSDSTVCIRWLDMAVSKTDLENTWIHRPQKHRPWKRCLYTKRAQNIHQGRLKFINKLRLPKIFKRAEAFLRSVFSRPSLCRNKIHSTIGSIQPGFCWWRYSMPHFQLLSANTCLHGSLQSAVFAWAPVLKIALNANKLSQRLSFLSARHFGQRFASQISK